MSTVQVVFRVDRRVDLPEVTSPELTWPEVTSPEAILTGSHVPRSGPDRKWSRAHAQPDPAFFSYDSSSTKCIIAHDRHGYRMWRDPEWGFPWKGGVRACAISVLVGHFDVIKHDPVGLSPGKYASAHVRPEVSLRCSLGRPRHIYHFLSLSLVICPSTAILLAPSIITQ
jgi:hypothetical protein